MTEEVRPEDTARAGAYRLWMKVPNPMVTFTKTLDVTRLVRVSRKRRLKFNMLILYCIGKAASGIPEFYTLPVGDKLIRYDALAVNTIVKGMDGSICSCDLRFSDDLAAFSREYLAWTRKTARTLEDRDLSRDCMVIGTSAVLDTELDGAIGMYTGVYCNPFLIWGRFRRRLFGYSLPVSFQFHHTQMDGAHAGRFLEDLQTCIKELPAG